MGRLTLNVLLSFAQFEREVTGERIRDKIAASKKKGMWMGGPLPLGYAVQDRALVIVPAEADIVRHIFTRYGALGSGAALIEELQADGYRTRLRVHGHRQIGGVPFQRGMLFHILSNPIYIGKIAHHHDVHDGEHEAIIDDDLWAQVQDRIAANRVEHKGRRSAVHSSPLVGLLRDGHGRRMSPSHAVKGKRRYRYYITHSSELRSDGPPSWRLPAADIETAVIERMQQMLSDTASIHAILPQDVSAQQLVQAIDAAKATAQRLDEPYGRRVTLPSLLRHVESAEDQVVITLDRDALGRTFGLPLIEDQDRFILKAQATKVRAGKATKLIIGNNMPSTPGRDDRLIALLTEAQNARAAVLAAPQTDIKTLARQRHQCRHRLAKLIRLSWLSPKIVTMILSGEHPASLTPTALLNLELPLRWTHQEAVLLAG